MQKMEELPRLVQRKCGGWLALSPHGASLKIGVAGASEQDARLKYETSVGECRAALARAGVIGYGD